MFDGARLREGQTVVVEGSRIAAAGDAADVAVPAGCEEVATRGRTLLPGFIDAHVHLGLCSPGRVLAGGVTTARDLGWTERRIFRVAADLGSDPSAGPRLLAAGPMLTAPGGHPSRARWCPRGTAHEVASVLEAEGVVQALAARGAAVIKVAQEPRAGPTLAPELLAAIVARAHQASLRVTSHCGSLGQLELALDVGVDELAHGLWSNEEMPEAVVARMVTAGMVVVPTLHIDPSPERVANLGRFVAAGGRVVYGTDMGNAGPPQGIDVTELSLMVRAGMSPGEALGSGTALAAAHLGLSGPGRIEEGAGADLVLVEGDPVADLTVLARPVLVLREGHRAR